MDQMELRIAARHAAMRAELMKKEIDHRVMNSLQFISGLLSMQSHSLDLTDAAGALQMAANREIGRSHVCNPVTNSHLICRLLLEKKKQSILNFTTQQ